MPNSITVGASSDYVQSVTAGLSEVAGEISKMREAFEAAKAPTNSLRDSIGKVKESADQASLSIGKIGSLALSQLGPLGRMANAVKAIWDGVGSQKPTAPTAPASTLKGAIAPPPKAPQFPQVSLGPTPPPILKPAPAPVLKPAVATPAAGGLSGGMMAGIAAAIGIVAAAANHLIGTISSAKDTVIGLAKAGFQGTVELARYQFQMQLISREVAGALVPVLNLLTSALSTARRTIEGFGANGQRALAAVIVGMTLLSGVVSVLGVGLAGLVAVGSPVLMIFFGAAAAITAFLGAVYLAYQASAELRAAVATLRGAFSQLVQSLEPVGAILLGIGQFLFKVFVVAPLIRFIEYLTIMVKVLERAANLFARLTGIGGLKIPDGGPKTSVSLNQTGQESGDQTFQRIQQAILQQGTAEEKEDYAKDASVRLGDIDKKIDALITVVSQAVAALTSLNVPSPGEVGDVARRAGRAAFGPLGALLG